MRGAEEGGKKGTPPSFWGCQSHHPLGHLEMEQCTDLASRFPFLWEKPWTVSASPQFSCKLFQEMYANKKTLISSCRGWCAGSG